MQTVILFHKKITYAGIWKEKSAVNLSDLGINVGVAHWNLSPEELVKKTLALDQGVLNDTGALCVDTGKFTGRSPKDKFTVKDAITEHSVDWGDVNIPFSPEAFDKLYNKVCAYMEGKEVWVRDSYACADPAYRLNIRVINETPWANLFCNDLFLRPTTTEIETQNHDWLILQAPGFLPTPQAMVPARAILPSSTSPGKLYSSVALPIPAK